MSDGRSIRKAKVLPFINELDRDRRANINALISKAKLMKLDGFELVEWGHQSWTINGGRLTKLTGKNITSATFNFPFSVKADSEILNWDWGDVAKSLFVLRFHRKHQAAPNQRSFISAIGYIAGAASDLGVELIQLTPEVLDKACSLISKDFSEGTAYNLHKHVGEFAAHCDTNGLCRILLQYKYSKMKRPIETGGINHKRLDDPEVQHTKSDKMIDPVIFKVIGELYLNVPKKHKYRFYVLMLAMLACTGRRFSEVSLLPFQVILFDEDNKAYINYFPRKSSQGDVFTPLRKLYLPTEVAPIVKDVLEELVSLTATSRITANEMHDTKGPDLQFLSNISDDQRLYNGELQGLGISETTIGINGAIRKAGFTWQDLERLTSQGRVPNHPFRYTNKQGVTSYCYRDFSEKTLDPIHTDQFGKEYCLKDMLFIRPLGLSSGFYAHWLATICTQSMFTTFLRYLPDLALEFASNNIEVDFTSHHFRHTLNTLLDEGGLSDLLQTEWFGRTNPRDTKAYQHTSREKRALMLREDIKKGMVGGKLAEQIKFVPVEIKDAILKARVQAVHDVGTGICIHNFSQTPCERHLQCSADCKDYVWAKDDKGRVEEQKRQYAMAKLARQAAEVQLGSNKPKKSVDWLVHNDKKLTTLKSQLSDNGVDQFDLEQYINEVGHGKSL